MTFQQMQATSISRHVLMIGEGFSKPSDFLDVLPLSLFDMLLAIGGAGRGGGLVLDLFMFSLRSTLVGGSFFCLDLGPMWHMF